LTVGQGSNYFDEGLADEELLDLQDGVSESMSDSPAGDYSSVSYSPNFDQMTTFMVIP